LPKITADWFGKLAWILDLLVSSELFWFCIVCFPEEKIPKAKLLYVPRLVELPWLLPTQVEFRKSSEFGRSLRSFITRRGGRYFAMLQQIRRNS